jgi:hypothetical protein
MKTLAVILLVFFSLNSYSQSKVYNTKIEKAIKVELKGGEAEIKSVENLTIAKIVIQDVKPKYSFAKLIRQKDSSGVYTTIITLSHSGDPESIYVNFGLEFDKPVNSVATSFSGSASNVSELSAYDKTWYTFKGFIQTTEKVIDIIIKSNTPVFIKISGVDANQN